MLSLKVLVSRPPGALRGWRMGLAPALGDPSLTGGAPPCAVWVYTASEFRSCDMPVRSYGVSGYIGVSECRFGVSVRSVGSELRVARKALGNPGQGCAGLTPARQDRMTSGARTKKISSVRVTLYAHHFSLCPTVRNTFSSRTIRRF